MRYQGYEIRREVLAFKPDAHTKAILVLLEHINWSSGEKIATSFTHMKNWMAQLCTMYNLEFDDMKDAVQAGCDKGWFTLSRDGAYLSLGDKPVLSFIEEQTAPVENLEVTRQENRIPLTRENIRALADCPKCGAKKGLMCFGHNKGLNNREANHKERSQAAARVLKAS